MKATFFLAVFLVGFVTLSPLAQTMPYHPWRKVGDLTCTLLPLYQWQAKWDAAQAEIKKFGQTFDPRVGPLPRTQQEIQRFNELSSTQTKLISKLVTIQNERPMSNWIGGGSSGTFTVEQVVPSKRLLLRWHTVGREETIVLVNHPLHDAVIDGSVISFFALRTGNYQYTDTRGATKTVPLYDYGIPVQPPTNRQQQNGPSKPKENQQ